MKFWEAMIEPFKHIPRIVNRLINMKKDELIFVLQVIWIFAFPIVPFTLLLGLPIWFSFPPEITVWFLSFGGIWVCYSILVIVIYLGDM